VQCLWWRQSRRNQDVVTDCRIHSPRQGCIVRTFRVPGAAAHRPLELELALLGGKPVHEDPTAERVFRRPP
jgi:hypothetical protein